MFARIADELNTRGHDAISIKKHQLRGSGDEVILFEAAQEGRCVVTHNEKDFKLLHRAWLRWPLSMEHAGILVVPQKYALSVRAIVEQLERFAGGGQPAQNRLYQLQQSPPRGLSYVWEEWIPR